MADTTGIEWTDSTWSPLRVRVREDAAAIAEAKGYASLVEIAGRMAGRAGPHCEHVSAGCEHCYAETNNHRCLPANGTGLPYDRRSRDLVESFVDEKLLLQPLKWKPILTGIKHGDGELREKKHRDGTVTVTRERPRRIFVENQSDLFGEWVTDEQLDRVFAVMALCPQHTFQVLTKRPERMLKYLSDEDTRTRIAQRISRWAHDGVVLKKQGWRDSDNQRFAAMKSATSGPLPNVWLGVSVEDQAAADKRIPLLLQTPAAVRFISAEPLLGPVDLRRLAMDGPNVWTQTPCLIDGLSVRNDCAPALNWVICGGESGAGARMMDPDWARGLRDQCSAAGVPFFFKQWGTVLPPNTNGAADSWAALNCNNHPIRVDKKIAGALLDGREWREFPAVRG